ncbi:CitMHS family transporter [Falsirhodobacter deserti]|uniref:CitMHS family transporter n=1 Tax=Falsirhodobacter deserti TaxID=1365611 RepID=UPI000FE2E88E|nr:citrate:proton symporter [Falsirhodobacter deserti]
MLAFIGLVTIVLVVGFLLIGKMSPIVALTLVPIISALVAGFGPDALAEFFNAGLGRVMQIATMFIFAITFFGVLQDTGLFRPIINGLIRMTRGHVVAVTAGTALVGVLAHLDGAGATTFLLTVPALLPLYLRLGMSRYLMLMMLAIGAGIANMLPWAGPLGRAAAVTGIDVSELWQPLIPIQVLGVVLLLVLAVCLGIREQRRVGAEGPSGVEAGHDLGGVAASAEEAALERHRLLPVNAVLFLAVLASLVTGILPPALIFMIGLSLVLLVNYPRVEDQMQRIRAHAPSALLMGAIILSAGTFLGIMDGTGMLRAMAVAMVSVLPEAAIGNLHLIVGAVGMPLELVLSTDAFYFGMLPIVLEVVQPTGVPADEIVHAMVIGNIIGTFASPFSPALWLALGLARADIGTHLRYSFFWMWGFSLVVFGAAMLMGLF